MPWLLECDTAYLVDVNQLFGGTAELKITEVKGSISLQNVGT